MIRSVFCILTFSLFTTLAFADGGSAHVIKARVTVDKKEYVGYFQVAGYLYLNMDSLKSWTNNVTGFTKRAKEWIFGDTLVLYSQIIQVKNAGLILYPTDKRTKFSKHRVAQIYPLELIDDITGRSSHARVTSSDATWLLAPIHTQEYFDAGNEFCGFTVLYFSVPNKETRTLVKAVESEMRKEVNDPGRYQVWLKHVNKLKTLKVIVFGDCS